MKSNFYPFSLILLLMGYDISITNTNKMCFKTVFMYFNKLAICLAMVYNYWVFIQELLLIMVLYESLFVISFLIKLFILSISLIYFQLNVSKIRKLFANITKSITENELNKMKKCSQILTISWVIFLILCTSYVGYDIY